MNEGNESLPLGNPLVFEHSTPTGATEVAQRLVAFPFAPPDVKLKDKEPLSSSNDWFTKHDKNKIDQLGSLDFYASTGPESVGVVPKLHNTSAGIEIYQLPPPLTKETFEKTEGPYRSGVTKKYSNKRSGEKNCEVQGRYHGSVRARLFSHVSSSRSPGRGAARNVSDYGSPGIPKGRRPSPNDRPSELH